MGRLFTSGGQIIGALAPILQQNIQGWFPLGLTGLISLQSKGVSSVFSSTTVQKHQFFGAQTNSLWFSSHICTWLLEKPHLWQCRPSSAKWCFCFEYTIYVCHIFLSKEQVSFNFMAAVTVPSDFGAQENKICYEVMGPDTIILVFWMLSFKPAFSLSSFTLIKRLFSFTSLSFIRVVWSAYLRLLIFLLAILIPAWDSSSLAFHMIYSA